MSQANPYLVVPLIGAAGSGKTTLARAIGEVAGAAPRPVVVEGRSATVTDVNAGPRIVQLVDFGDESAQRALLPSARATLAILVVSATDSVLPGTRDALIAAHQAGTRIVAVALTRCDDVDDPELLDLVTMEVQTMLVRQHAGSDETPVIQTALRPRGGGGSEETDPVHGARRLLATLVH